jgi:hypothetical protein
MFDPLRGSGDRRANGTRTGTATAVSEMRDGMEKATEALERLGL